MTNPPRFRNIATCLTLALLISACTKQAEIATAPKAGPADKNAAPAEPPLDQTQVCTVTGWQKDVTSAACTEGQKVVFLPDSWGNEQLPIMFAAVNCDLRYSVALTHGGVACIYKALKPTPAPEPTAPDPATKGS